MRHPANRAQAGFTLVELIMTIVVMGLLAGMALPRLTDQQSLDELSTKDEVKSMLRLARSVAMSQNRDVCFVRTAAQLLLVYAPTGVCAAANTPVVKPVMDGESTVTLRPGVTFAGVVSVRFNNRGQLMPLGTANQQITVGSLPALTISRETGFVY